MKLKPPIQHRPRKLSLVLDGDDLPAFERYQRYYHDIYAKEIDLAEMIVELAAVTIDSDREFKGWIRKVAPTTGQAPHSL